MKSIQIRQPTASDQAAIDAVHLDAFGPQEGPEIIKLVNDLLADKTAEPRLSLVAEQNGRLAGHVLFTGVQLQHSMQKLSLQILAPLAVATGLHRKGIGGSLVREGLRRLAESGVDLVFVLGHPAYYPRFGFQAAGEAGFEAPHPIPAQFAEAWMVQELTQGLIGTVRGKIVCSKVLNELQYWQI